MHTSAKFKGRAAATWWYNLFKQIETKETFSLFFSITSYRFLLLRAEQPRQNLERCPGSQGVQTDSTFPLSENLSSL